MGKQITFFRGFTKNRELLISFARLFMSEFSVITEKDIRDFVGTKAQQKTAIYQRAKEAVA